MAEALRACVLAAGKGTRMGGDRPKVLFEAGGKPLLEWVLSALSAAGVTDVVAVVGFGKDEVIHMLPTGVRWVEQSPQLGTGHALRCARSLFAGDGSPILVACGDMPLIRAESFRAVANLRLRQDAAAAVLTTRIAPASRFGRVLRAADGLVQRIVEAREATAEELKTDEGNTGVYCFQPEALWPALERVGDDNTAGE